MMLTDDHRDDPALNYLLSWKYPYPAEYLTSLGTSDAEAAGVAFLQAYGHLLPSNFYYNVTNVRVPIRSTDQERVNATANAFAAGMMGSNYANRSTWSVTPDSLTTFNSTLASNNCPAVNTIESQANGIFNAYFQPRVQRRLASQLPGFNLTVNDIGSLMNACPFDSFNNLSPSPICSLFEPEEWNGYNYAYDLTQFGELACSLSDGPQIQGLRTLTSGRRKCRVWWTNWDGLGCRLGRRDDRTSE